MPAKGYLSLSQKEKLQLALKTEEDAKVRERILMLLLRSEWKNLSRDSRFSGSVLKKSSLLVCSWRPR